MTDTWEWEGGALAPPTRKGKDVNDYEGWTMTPHQAMRIVERATSGNTEGLKAAQISEAVNRLWELVLKGE